MNQSHIVEHCAARTFIDDTCAISTQYFCELLYFNEVQRMADKFNFIHMQPVRNDPFETAESDEEM